MANELKAKAIIEVLKQGSGAQEAARDLQSVEGAADKAASRMEAFGRQLGVSLTAATIVNFTKQAVEAFAESEEASRRLEGALRSQGKFTEEYFDHLGNRAKEFQEQFKTVSDETVMDIQTSLIQFGALRSEMDRLVPAVLDLSAGRRIDPRQAADLVGKALQGETGMFGRLGFQIDEAADSATKLEQVLAQIQQRFGGLAAGEINTLTGQMKALKEQWNEFLEKWGGAVAPLVQTWLKGMSAIADKINELNAPEPEHVDARQQDERGAQLAKQLVLEAQITKEHERRAELIRMAKYVNDTRNLVEEGKATPENLQKVIDGGQGLLRRSNPNYVEFQGPPVLPPAEGPRTNPEEQRRKLAADAKENAEVWGAAWDEEEKQRAANAKENAEVWGAAWEAEEQQRTINSKAAQDAIQDQERDLTIEALQSSETRIEQAVREFQARASLYEELKEKGVITESEYTQFVKDAAYDRTHAVATEENRRMAEAKARTEQLMENTKVDLEQITDTFAGGLAHTIVDAFRTGRLEMREFFADFTAYIAEAIMKALIWRAIIGAMNAVAGGAGSAASSAGSSGGLTSFNAAFGAGGIATRAADGVEMLSTPTYFPRFNVLAGEAGTEALAVLSRPRVESFNGRSIMSGLVQGREMSVVPRGALAAADGVVTGPGLQDGSAGVADRRPGRLLVDVSLEQGLRATIIAEAVEAAITRTVREMSRDSTLNQATKRAVGTA